MLALAVVLPTFIVIVIAYAWGYRDGQGEVEKPTVRRV